MHGITSEATTSRPAAGSGPGSNGVSDARAALLKLFAAATPDEAAAAIAEVEAATACRWRPVGDNDNNLATINLGTDPAMGLVERITNAIDAVLEREWIERGGPTGIRNPREAVEAWFGIDGGRLGGVVSLREPRAARLASRVHVTLKDSGNSKRPTVEVRDYGIGIPAREFADSILSLQRNRKLRKRHLAGEFGQGGSTALSYSEYAVIASRGRGPLGHALHRVAITVVRFNPGDPQVDKHGVYEYLVDDDTGIPLTVELPETDFPSGTLVRHIEMDLGKYRSALTAPKSSLSYLANHYLFDPVLPFTIEEGRRNSDHGEGWAVGGNHRLLERADEVEYRRHATLSFRSGELGLSWWVLAAEGENPRNQIMRYTLPSKPIVITYNGQKQGELPNTIIKDDLRLAYLERYLIVHVDCDRLDNESRRQLFPTTRESLRDTSLLEELRALVTDTLHGDEALRRLDRERKQRYLGKEDSQAVESIRRRLARRLRQTTLARRRGRTPRLITEPGAGDADRIPVEVVDPPTLLEIVGRVPKHVRPGRPFALRFRTDADPSYFERPDAFLVLVDPFNFARYSGRTDVHDGRGVAYFDAGEQLVEDDRGEITLELWSPNGPPIGSSVGAVVTPPPEAAARAEQKKTTPNINPQWVNRGDPFWNENGWDDRSVARVVRDERSIEVYVSADNKRLSRLIARGQRRNPETVEALKEFYLEHVSFHALLLELDRERVEASAANPTGGASLEETEQERELRRACETVCGVMEGSFELFVAKA